MVLSNPFSPTSSRRYRRDCRDVSPRRHHQTVDVVSLIPPLEEGVRNNHLQSRQKLQYYNDTSNSDARNPIVVSDMIDLTSYGVCVDQQGQQQQQQLHSKGQQQSRKENMDRRRRRAKSSDNISRRHESTMQERRDEPPPEYNTTTTASSPATDTTPRHRNTSTNEIRNSRVVRSKSSGARMRMSYGATQHQPLMVSTTTSNDMSTVIAILDVASRDPIDLTIGTGPLAPILVTDPTSPISAELVEHLPPPEIVSSPISPKMVPLSSPISPEMVPLSSPISPEMVSTKKTRKKSPKKSPQHTTSSSSVQQVAILEQQQQQEEEEGRDDDDCRSKASSQRFFARRDNEDDENHDKDVADSIQRSRSGGFDKQTSHPSHDDSRSTGSKKSEHDEKFAVVADSDNQKQRFLPSLSPLGSFSGREVVGTTKYQQALQRLDIIRRRAAERRNGAAKAVSPTISQTHEELVSKHEKLVQKSVQFRKILAATSPLSKKKTPAPRSPETKITTNSPAREIVDQGQAIIRLENERLAEKAKKARSWNRLFIDTTAVSDTLQPASTNRSDASAVDDEEAKDFMTAFSYEFKRVHGDTTNGTTDDYDNGDIIYIEDLLPSKKSSPKNRVKNQNGIVSTSSSSSDGISGASIIPVSIKLRRKNRIAQLNPGKPEEAEPNLQVCTSEAQDKAAITKETVNDEDLQSKETKQSGNSSFLRKAFSPSPTKTTRALWKRRTKPNGNKHSPKEVVDFEDDGTLHQKDPTTERLTPKPEMPHKFHHSATSSDDVPALTQVSTESHASQSVIQPSPSNISAHKTAADKMIKLEPTSSSPSKPSTAPVSSVQSIHDPVASSEAEKLEPIPSDLDLIDAINKLEPTPSSDSSQLNHFFAEKPEPPEQNQQIPILQRHVDTPKSENEIVGLDFVDHESGFAHIQKALMDQGINTAPSDEQIVGKDPPSSDDEQKQKLIEQLQYHINKHEEDPSVSNFEMQHSLNVDQKQSGVSYSNGQQQDDLCDERKSDYKSNFEHRHQSLVVGQQRDPSDKEISGQISPFESPQSDRQRKGPSDMGTSESRFNFDRQQIPKTLQDDAQRLHPSDKGTSEYVPHFVHQHSPLSSHAEGQQIDSYGTSEYISDLENQPSTQADRHQTNQSDLRTSESRSNFDHQVIPQARQINSAQNDSTDEETSEYFRNFEHQQILHEEQRSSQDQQVDSQHINSSDISGSNFEPKQNTQVQQVHSQQIDLSDVGTSNFEHQHNVQAHQVESQHRNSSDMGTSESRSNFEHHRGTEAHQVETHQIDASHIEHQHSTQAHQVERHQVDSSLMEHQHSTQAHQVESHQVDSSDMGTSESRSNFEHHSSQARQVQRQGIDSSDTRTSESRSNFAHHHSTHAQEQQVNSTNKGTSERMPNFEHQHSPQTQHVNQQIDASDIETSFEHQQNAQARKVDNQQIDPSDNRTTVYISSSDHQQIQRVEEHQLYPPDIDTSGYRSNLEHQQIALSLQVDGQRIDTSGIGSSLVDGQRNNISGTGTSVSRLNQSSQATQSELAISPVTNEHFVEQSVERQGRQQNRRSSTSPTFRSFSPKRVDMASIDFLTRRMRSFAPPMKSLLSQDTSDMSWKQNQHSVSESRYAKKTSHVSSDSSSGERDKQESSDILRNQHYQAMSESRHEKQSSTVSSTFSNDEERDKPESTHHSNGNDARDTDFTIEREMVDEKPDTLNEDHLRICGAMRCRIDTNNAIATSTLPLSKRESPSVRVKDSTDDCASNTVSDAIVKVEDENPAKTTAKSRVFPSAQIVSSESVEQESSSDLRETNFQAKVAKLSTQAQTLQGGNTNNAFHKRETELHNNQEIKNEHTEAIETNNHASIEPLTLLTPSIAEIPNSHTTTRTAKHPLQSPTLYRHPTIARMPTDNQKQHAPELSPNIHDSKASDVPSVKAKTELQVALKVQGELNNSSAPKNDVHVAKVDHSDNLRYNFSSEFVPPINKAGSESSCSVMQEKISVAASKAILQAKTKNLALGTREPYKPQFNYKTQDDSSSDETASKISIADSVSSATDSERGAARPRAAHFAMRILDTTCAWLEGEECCLSQNPLLSKAKQTVGIPPLTPKTKAKRRQSRASAITQCFEYGRKSRKSKQIDHKTTEPRPMVQKKPPSRRKSSSNRSSPVSRDFIKTTDSVRHLSTPVTSNIQRNFFASQDTPLSQQQHSPTEIPTREQGESPLSFSRGNKPDKSEGDAMATLNSVEPRSCTPTIIGKDYRLDLTPRQKAESYSNINARKEYERSKNLTDAQKEFGLLGQMQSAQETDSHEYTTVDQDLQPSLSHDAVVMDNGIDRSHSDDVYTVEEKMAGDGFTAVEEKRKSAADEGQASRKSAATTLDERTFGKGAKTVEVAATDRKQQKTKATTTSTIKTAKLTSSDSAETLSSLEVEQRIAAVELADKLRRKAATLKKRRQMRKMQLERKQQQLASFGVKSK